MNGEDTVREFFDTLARVLFWCWLFGFALVTVWFAVYLTSGEMIYRLHGHWFGLSPHELDLLLYGAMGLTKVLVWTFFFFPWLAIRLVLKRLAISN